MSPQNDSANLPGYPQQLPGINAGQQASSLLDPKMMDMMMMMGAMGGSGNNNNFMMLPMMQEMMQHRQGQNGAQATGENGAGFNPQMMQQMLLQNMMPNIDNLFNRDKDN